LLAPFTGSRNIYREDNEREKINREREIENELFYPFSTLFKVRHQGKEMWNSLFLRSFLEEVLLIHLFRQILVKVM
jgi:hypothetical protein